MARRLLDRPELVAHDVVTRAMHRADDDDFDGTAWSEPLEVLTRSLDREAGLTVRGRRQVRSSLVGRLVERRRFRIAPRTDRGAPSTDDRPRPTVIVTAADPDSVRRAEQALGAPGRGAALLTSTFTTMGFEVLDHVPSYAEWLAEADLAATYADLARFNAAPRRTPIPFDVLGAVDFGERLTEIDRSFPGALLVEVVRPLDEAVSATARECALLRLRRSRDVDAAKVERYWGWRLGLREERRSGGRVADLTFAYGDLVATPGSLASAVKSAIGGWSPPR